MLIGDFKLAEHNHFVAMEYYGFILNRTYLLLLVSDCLVGIVANGIVAAEGGRGLVKWLSSRLAIRGDLADPKAYINAAFLGQMASIDLQEGDLSESHRANFRLPLNQVHAISFDPSPKWGMGYYPHDGKIRVVTRTLTREFIVLGNQSGRTVRDWLWTATTAANERGISTGKPS